MVHLLRSKVETQIIGHLQDYNSLALVTHCSSSDKPAGHSWLQSIPLNKHTALHLMSQRTFGYLHRDQDISWPQT